MKPTTILPTTILSEKPVNNASRRRFLSQISAGAVGLMGSGLLMGCLDETTMSNLKTLYVGTYTNGDSRGIYRLRLNDETGLLDKPELVAVTENPSYLALHPTGKWLYAVNELMEFDGKESGAITAYAIAPDTGELLALNQQASNGGAPCYISVDATGQWVLVANYMGGNVTMYPVEEGGMLGDIKTTVQHAGSSVNERRQAGPHAHAVMLSPDNNKVVVADLGIDQVRSYDLNSQAGTLVATVNPLHVQPGAGPRHIAFHPDGEHAFIINELDSTMLSARYTPATGAFEILDTISTLPDSFTGTSYCADIHVSPDGRFVYGSNRGHDSIVIVAFDAATGKLEAVGHESTKGKTPRNFTLDPSGKYLLAANQNSNTIFVFKRNEETGLLASTGQRVEVPSPVCLKFA